MEKGGKLNMIEETKMEKYKKCNYEGRNEGRSLREEQVDIYIYMIRKYRK